MAEPRFKSKSGNKPGCLPLDYCNNVINHYHLDDCTKKMIRALYVCTSMVCSQSTFPSIIVIKSHHKQLKSVELDSNSN